MCENLLPYLIKFVIEGKRRQDMVWSQDKGYQAFAVLKVLFVLIPVLAGLDKFFYLLTNWSGYIAPVVLQAVNGHDRGFMAIVGVVEIVAGIGVWLRPRIFSYIVSLWLLGIVINLLLTGQFFDVAVRDLGLAVSAFCLGKLSQKYA
jgi:hypothetical protein